LPVRPVRRCEAGVPREWSLSSRRNQARHGRRATTLSSRSSSLPKVVWLECSTGKESDEMCPMIFFPPSTQKKDFQGFPWGSEKPHTPSAIHTRKNKNVMGGGGPQAGNNGVFFRIRTKSLFASHAIRRGRVKGFSAGKFGKKKKKNRSEKTDKTQRREFS